MDNYKKFEDITEENISDWKSTKKKVTQISVAIDEDDVSSAGPTAKFVICQPDRNVLEATARASSEKNYSKANKLMKTNCILGGDMKYIEAGSADFNLEIELEVLDQIGLLVEKKKAAVKKL